MDIRDKIKEHLGEKVTDWKEVSGKRIYFSVDKKDIYATTELLFKKLGLRFSTATGMENPEGMEILYHFSYDAVGELYSVRVAIADKKHPEVESITPLFPGAEWIEREMWEMLGINFKNHPNLKRLLLADEWPADNFPLRKQKEQPR